MRRWNRAVVLDGDCWSFWWWTRERLQRRLFEPEPEPELRLSTRHQDTKVGHVCGLGHVYVRDIATGRRPLKRGDLVENSCGPCTPLAAALERAATRHGVARATRSSAPNAFTQVRSRRLLDWLVLSAPSSLSDAAPGRRILATSARPPRATRPRYRRNGGSSAARRAGPARGRRRAVPDRGGKKDAGKARAARTRAGTSAGDAGPPAPAPGTLAPRRTRSSCERARSAERRTPSACEHRWRSERHGSPVRRLHSKVECLRARRRRRRPRAATAARSRARATSTAPGRTARAGQPANSCTPGSLSSSLTAGCQDANVYRQTSCTPDCTWDNFSRTCSTPPELRDRSPDRGRHQEHGGRAA